MDVRIINRVGRVQVWAMADARHPEGGSLCLADGLTYDEAVAAAARVLEETRAELMGMPRTGLPRSRRKLSET